MKRTLAIIGFSMLSALTVLCKVNSFNAVSVTVAVTLTFLFISLIIPRIRKNMTVPVALASVLFALILLCCANARLDAVKRDYSDKTISVSGVLTELPYKRYSQSYYMIRTNTVNGVKKHINIRLTSDTPVDFEPSDIINAEICTFMLADEKDELYDYYKSDNVILGAYFSDSGYTVTKGFDASISSLILKVRSNIYNEIMHILPNDYGAIACGLVLGEKAALSDKTVLCFRLCGASHLFAVSGLHISIWSYLIYSSLRRAGLSNKKTSVLSMLFCLFFIILTGFRPPVVRAGIMMTLIYISNILYLEADATNSIGLSLIIMLIVNPYCAMSMSLWLSLLATMGIILVFNSIYENILLLFASVENKLIRQGLSHIASVLGVCLSVNIFTLPVYFVTFKSISLVLIISNFTMVILGKYCMVLSGIGAAFMLIKLKFAGSPLIIISGLIAKLIIKISKLLSSFKYVLIPVGNPVIMALFFISAFILLIMAAVFRKKIKVLRITALILSFVFVLTCTFIYSSSLSKPEIVVADTNGGIALIVKCDGHNIIIMGDSNNYYAEGIICGIMNDKAISRISSLMIFTDEAIARKIISSYDIEEIICNNEYLKRDFGYDGASCNLEHCIRTYGRLSFATQKDFCQIICNNRKIVVCFDNSSIPENLCCDILVCRSTELERINTDNIKSVIACGDNNEASCDNNIIFTNKATINVINNEFVIKEA